MIILIKVDDLSHFVYLCETVLLRYLIETFNLRYLIFTVMSNFIIIAADMHKIAAFSINVKYRQPGNVVEYLPVEFEIYQDGNYFEAIPLPCSKTRTLTNLRNEYTFQLKNGKTYDWEKGT